MEASSLDSQGSNTSCVLLPVSNEGSAVSLCEVFINLYNLVYNLNKNSTVSYSPKETKK